MGRSDEGVWRAGMNVSESAIVAKNKAKRLGRSFHLAARPNHEPCSEISGRPFLIPEREL